MAFVLGGSRDNACSDYRLLRPAHLPRVPGSPHVASIQTTAVDVGHSPFFFSPSISSVTIRANNVAG